MSFSTAAKKEFSGFFRSFCLRLKCEDVQSRVYPTSSLLFFKFSLLLSLSLIIRIFMVYSSSIFFFTILLFFFFFMNDIQNCFICRPSDSTVWEDAGIEPRTVATTHWLSVRGSNHARLDLIFLFLVFCNCLFYFSCFFQYS
jgi:hypothetical protein